MKLLIVFFFVVYMFTSVTGCSDETENQEPYYVSEDKNTGTIELNYSVLSFGTQSGIKNQQIHVINTDNEYSELISGISYDGDMPKPDLTVTTLVAIFSGYESSVCDTNAAIEIRNIVKSNRKYVINAIYSEAGAICLGVNAKYGPYLFVEIAKTNDIISVAIEF